MFAHLHHNPSDLTDFSQQRPWIVVKWPTLKSEIDVIEVNPSFDDDDDDGVNLCNPFLSYVFTK